MGDKAQQHNGSKSRDEPRPTFALQNRADAGERQSEAQSQTESQSIQDPNAGNVEANPKLTMKAATLIVSDPSADLGDRFCRRECCGVTGCRIDRPGKASGEMNAGSSSKVSSSACACFKIDEHSPLQILAI